ARWESNELTAGGGYSKSLRQDGRDRNGESQSPSLRRERCHPDLQLRRPNPGQGRKDGTGAGKIHARFCEKGQHMGVSPCKLRVGSDTQTITICRREKVAVNARTACWRLLIFRASRLDNLTALSSQVGK